MLTSKAIAYRGKGTDPMRRVFSAVGDVAKAQKICNDQLLVCSRGPSDPAIRSGRPGFLECSGVHAIA
jgi:hypothetical protein